MKWLQLSWTVDAAEHAFLEEILGGCGAGAISSSAATGDANDMSVASLEVVPGAAPQWRQVRVAGLFDAGVDVQRVRTQVEDLCSTAQAPASSWLEDRDWTRVWMERAAPLRFGSRLWVVPSHLEPPAAAAVVVRLDPGGAFGSGTHETTALCLEWLEAHAADLRHRTLLDYGCGSGILGIAAARLGAARVYAWDTDPRARDATRDNALHNGIAHRLHVATAPTLESIRCDVLVANILAATLCDLAAAIAAHQAAGATLLLAGVLEEQVSQVAARYQPWYDVAAAAERRGWALLVGRRRQAASGIARPAPVRADGKES